MHAATAQRTRFRGFTGEGLDLLRQLAANNSQAWFEARRQPFHALLVEPALDLVADLGPLLRNRISPGLRAEPRIGGSLLRMRHDSRNNRGDPFRTSLELWFWEGDGPSHQHPGFFVRVGADELVLGAGITLFPPDLLLCFRSAVDEPPTGRRLVAVLHRLEDAGWRMAGARVQRVPRPYSADHERGSLLRQLGLRVERSEAAQPALLSTTLTHRLAADLAPLRPLHHWLLRIR